jgi:D-amino-acid dehydrogenase
MERSASGASGASVVVVGGGLVGMSLAYELVTAGADTVLIDRHDPGRATDAGAGILSPETNLDPDPALFGFGSAAARHHATLTERLEDDGASGTGFAVTGSLLVAERPGDDGTMAMAVELVGRRSPGLAEEIEPGEVSRFFPLLGPVRRALFNPAGRRVDGRVLNEALRRAAQSRGLRVISSGATGVALDPRGGAIEGVVTDEGTVAADTVVIAGGAWSPEMASAFGVTLPVHPLKGQIIHLSVPDADTRAWTIVQPVLSYYLVPWPDGRVACGGTMEASAGFDHRPTAGGLYQLLRECLRTAPGLAQSTVAEVRVGTRPSTPDDRPVLGRLPGWTNAFVATGHGAEGLLLGPLSALMVARQVLGIDDAPEGLEGDALSQVLELCAPTRFAGSS